LHHAIQIYSNFVFVWLIGIPCHIMHELDTPANARNLPLKTGAIRHKILLQAKLLFGQKGYCAVSMNDLVTSIGISKPTVYYHFMDKETLFTETIVDMLRHGQELFGKNCIICVKDIFSIRRFP
jgi:hypothetical protein